jgi:DNA-binding transcriptional LysR family regulator
VRPRRPTSHRLAARKEIRPQDIANEIYIAPTRVAPVLNAVLDNYAAKPGISLRPKYDAEDLSSAMSLVASTGSVTLLPQYAQYGRHSTLGGRCQCPISGVKGTWLPRPLIVS